VGMAVHITERIWMAALQELSARTRELYTV